MKENKKWEMSFDLNTLEHLGVKLYTQYPLMIAELISNSWDADALNVKIKLEDKQKNEKKIIIIDDGHSMNFDELNECFLNIGRNRRVTYGKSESLIFKRPVLGKKGIGKLSMFGIADKITIIAVKDGRKNSFRMEYSKMKSSGGTYSPEELIIDEETIEKNGTIIILEEIKRSSNFNPTSLSENLSKRFNIFDKMNVEIYHNENEALKIENKEIFSKVENQFEWKIPEDLKNKQGFSTDVYNYLVEKEIVGKILTAKTPLKKLEQGVVLMAREKLVQENAFFDDRSNDYFHSYLYGILNIDFIDSDNEEDYVATDRKSLIWEGEELEILKGNLNEVLKYIEKDWRKERENAKKKEFKELRGIDIDCWINSLSPAEKGLAEKISKSILNNPKLDDTKAISLFEYVQDAFSLQGFQEFASTLESLDILSETEAIKLLDDWQFIEAKELAKLSKGRINTINQFEKYIHENVSETKVMQKFLEEFPWILDPRMTSFEREVTYTKLLKDNFKEDDIVESNKRIDFLCTNNSGKTYIIELKRPLIKITMNEISQVCQYAEFIEKKFPETVDLVKTILITENHNYAPGVETMINGLKKDGKFEFKSYSDLLAEARRYHGEFIKKYEELSEFRNKKEA